jgi:hypothetical protein
LAGNIVRMEDKRNRYRSLIRNPGWKTQFQWYILRRERNINMGHTQLGFESVGRFHVVLIGMKGGVPRTRATSPRLS